MKKILLASLLLLCGCGGGTPLNSSSQNQSTISIAQMWNVAVADSASTPSGWSISAQSINTAALALNTCISDFNNLLLPNSLQIVPQACSLKTDIPAGTNTNWIQTMILGTTTEQLFSGETVTYVIVVQGDAGTESAILSGTGTFMNNQISGTLNCVSLGGVSCDGWTTNFTAAVQ